MRAVHFLRSRQEERELAYWLAIVAYDRRDRSINNRIYLVYLILFFGAWTFAALTFFASGGAALLRLIDPGHPVSASISIEVLMLAIWCIFTFWQSLKRSPVTFSEQDETLICQTPLNRRSLIMRWLWMPWLKSAVPFWLAAITLGFSIAEINMAGAVSTSRIIEYAGYGLRAWLVMVPIHLSLFILGWVIGVVRLQGNRERRWLAWLVMPVTILFFLFVLIFARNPAVISTGLWSQIAGSFLQPFQAGFSQPGLAVALLSGVLLTLLMLAGLYLVSASFNLSRAAQETREVETIQTAAKYGFGGLVKQQQLKRRLGVNKKPTRLPAMTGAGALVWKDLLQSRRSLSLQQLVTWLGIFSAMLALPFVPDLGSRALLIAFWVIQIGQVCVARLRDDLANWALIRQLPVSDHKILLFEPLTAYILSVLTSLAGLVVAALLLQAPIDGMVFSIAGMVVGIAGMAAFDVCRQSRDELLLAGLAPQLSALGSLLGFVVAGVPVLIRFSIAGQAGILLAAAASLGLGYLAFNLAVLAYRRVHNG
jgi:hypothetical protein